MTKREITKFKLVAKSIKFQIDFSDSRLRAMMRSKTTEKSVSKILSKIKAKHYDAARNDVINVLRVYRGLSPNLDTFVFDNGDER